MPSKEQYHRDRNRSPLGKLYAAKRGRGPDALRAGSIADIGEKLDQAQTDFILKFMAPGDKVSDAIAKIVIDHHHMMQGLDYDVYQWLKIQAHNSGVTYAEMIAAILFDAYAEEHNYD